MFSGGGVAFGFRIFAHPARRGFAPARRRFAALAGAGHALRACGAPYIAASPAALLIKAAVL